MKPHAVFMRWCFIIPAFIFTNSFSEQPQKAAPAHQPTIAVNTLQAQGITESEAATLTEVLGNKLMNTDKFQVMERSQMENILKEQAFQKSGACTDEACIVEMGQILGIEQMVAGSIGKVGKAYSINVRLIDIKTGKLIKSVSHNFTGPIESLLTTEMGVVANQLAGVESFYKEPRLSDQKKTGEKKHTGRNLTIGGLAVAAVGGGIAVLFIVRGKKEDSKVPETATVEIQWNY